MRDYQKVINILGEVGGYVGHVKIRFKFDKTFNEKEDLN